MKRISLIFVIILTFIILVKIDNLIINFLGYIMLLFFIILVLGNKMYQNFMEGRNPNIVNNLTRNYDKIILGEVTKKINIDRDLNKKILKLNNYKRNLYTDILVLERYYSFLKKDGTVCFYIDCANKKYLFSNTITILDNTLLHQVTLLEHGIDASSYIYKIKKYFNGIRFLLSFFAYENKVKKCLTPAEVELVKNNINRINKFSKSREINIEYNLYNYNDLLKQKLESENCSNNICKFW